MMVNVAMSKETLTVSPSMVQKAVTPPIVPKAVTDAHYVGEIITIPNHAATSDLLTIVTPLRADAWEHHLRSTNLYHLFTDIPFNIRNGFDMGVSSTINKTFTPNNYNSAISRPNIIEKHIIKELSAQRYTGPFSKSRLELLIGPFCTSPLGTVPKSNSLDEFRVIQDLSFPRNNPTHTSVNSEINAELFLCDWGTFTQMYKIVRKAPPGSQAATIDVDAAFRCCPIRPIQQPHFVIQWNNLFYIDHNAPFGATSSGGVFGRLADAMTALIRHYTGTHCLNWVDDFAFIRSPTNISDSTNSLPTYSYDLRLIENLAENLGWPWKPSKTHPFSTTFQYLGFLWDLDQKSVQIPTEKKSKYLNKLTIWETQTNFSRKEAESILGTLVHCSLALPDGRSHLPALSRFTSSFEGKSRFSRCTPNKTVFNDIRWWKQQLESQFAGSLITEPPTVSDINLWVDASTSWGIGVIFHNEWDSWKLKEGWNSHPQCKIGWAEIVAIECVLRLAIHRGYTNIHFSINSDNTGIINAIKGGKSRNPEHNIVLQRITTLIRTHSIWISSKFVPSNLNLADRLSCGLPVDNIDRSPDTFQLPEPLTSVLIPQPALIVPTNIQ